MNYNERIIVKERERWDELKALAAANDVRGFYQRYAEYLESQYVISEHRGILLKMAKLVATGHTIVASSGVYPQSRIRGV